MASDNIKIGIFDSGVGGLTVASQIKRYLPKVSIVYIGDTARVPWGTRSPKTVKTFALQMLRFLEKKKVDLAVVACHTASAVALASLRRATNIPIVGVIEPTIKSVLNKTAGSIGVIATPTTIKSHAWENTLKKGNKKKLKITKVSAPLLVPLVEEGEENNHIAQALVQKYTRPLKKKKIDTLVLACTHYSLLYPIFKKFLPNVQLINPGEETAKYVKKLISGKQRNSIKDEFYFTDLTSNVRTQVARFFGREANHLKEVKV